MKLARLVALVVALSSSLVALWSAPARAQDLNLAALDETTSVVHVRTGAEYGFVMGAGYARVLSVANRPLVLIGDATLPWASLDLGDYRLRAGALMPFAFTHHWQVAGSVAPTLRAIQTGINRMTDLGADFGVVGGYYTRRWFAAAEVGFDWALTTYIVHNQRYRDTIYAQARDGWYANPGGNVRAGAQGGVSFGRYDIVLRAGLVRDTSGGEPLLPFYGTLVVNTKW